MTKANNATFSSIEFKQELLGSGHKNPGPWHTSFFTIRIMICVQQPYTLFNRHKFALRLSIGVNRPAIVREIPHFGLFPAFPHFCENVPHFWLYFEVKKSMKIAIILAARRHFVRKSSEKTSMIALPLELLKLLLIKKYVNNR